MKIEIDLEEFAEQVKNGQSVTAKEEIYWSRFSPLFL